MKWEICKNWFFFIPKRYFFIPLKTISYPKIFFHTFQSLFHTLKTFFITLYNNFIPWKFVSYLEIFFHTFIQQFHTLWKLLMMMILLFVVCCAFISYQAPAFRTLSMVFHTKWPSFHTPNNQFHTHHLIFHSFHCQTHCHLRMTIVRARSPTASFSDWGRMQARGVVVRPWVVVVAVHGLRRGRPRRLCRGWSAGCRAGHSVQTRGGFCCCTDCGSVRGHQNWCPHHVTLHASTASIRCHLQPSHTLLETGPLNYTFFFCEFVPRNGGTQPINFIPHSYFHTKKVCKFCTRYEKWFSEIK